MDIEPANELCYLKSGPNYFNTEQNNTKNGLSRIKVDSNIFKVDQLILNVDFMIFKG